MRADKYLWAVRLFKTRSAAADALKAGRIQMNGMPIKAAKTLATGDLFTLRRPPVTYSFRVKELPKSRVGAPLVGDFLENLTPESELSKLRPAQNSIFLQRNPGTGRPTKKERRAIDALLDEFFEGLYDEGEE